jgi:hypothetical protein
MIAMSASELPWSEWRDAVIAEAQRLDSEIETALCDKVYPSGRRCIDDWRQELRDAAFRGDLIEVRRLAKMCRRVPLLIGCGGVGERNRTSRGHG